MYKVIKKFKDTDGKIYEVGDSYSNKDDARLEALLTNKNKCGYPFIEKVGETTIDLDAEKVAKKVYSRTKKKIEE